MLLFFCLILYRANQASIALVKRSAKNVSPWATSYEADLLDEDVFPFRLNLSDVIRKRLKALRHQSLVSNLRVFWQHPRVTWFPESFSAQTSSCESTMRLETWCLWREEHFGALPLSASVEVSTQDHLMAPTFYLELSIDSLSLASLKNIAQVHSTSLICHDFRDV